MFDGVVNIESSSNKSFGTGFVIDKDANGVYILTCKHVLDDVVTPMVEDYEARIIAKGDFIDLAVVYVEKLKLEPFSLTISSCEEDKVKVIGFSSFNTSINQKKHIQAKLYKELVELHSTKDESYYSVRKIQASKRYTFDRGNSGSPVICKESNEVIAVLSNKEGSDIGYAVDISYLKEIWKEMPSHVLKKSSSIKNHWSSSQTFLLNGTINLKAKMLKRYLLPLVAVVSFLAGGYFWMTPNPETIQDYKVVHLSKDSTLDVRAGKGEGHWKIGVLPYNAKNINLIECALNDVGDRWCNIQYGNTKGWVNSRYITEEKALILPNDEFNSKPINKEHKNVRLKFNYPASVKRGKPILITASLKNEGDFESSGGITLSFPQRPLLEYSKRSNNFKFLKKYKIGQKIYNNHKKQADKMEAIHPTIESNDINWTKGEEHHFSLALKIPEELNYLKIRVRGSLTLKRVVPHDGMMDQQAFASQEIIVKILD